MNRKIVIGIAFTVLEIVTGVASFYLLTEVLEKTNFPFTTNLFTGAIIGIATYATVGIVLLILVAALNQRITKETFNYKLAVPSLMIGSLIAYFIGDSIQPYRFKYEPEYFDFLMLVMSYSIPVMIFNIGIRFQQNRE